LHSSRFNTTHKGHSFNHSLFSPKKSLLLALDKGIILDNAITHTSYKSRIQKSNLAAGLPCQKIAEQKISVGVVVRAASKLFK